MKSNEVVLKLVLDELGIRADFRGVNDRKSIQSGVYLAQAARVDMGYCYGWYLMGPHCPALIQDYYSLRSALRSGESASDYVLNPQLKKKLAALQPILQIPFPGLAKHDWLEALASVHYLRVSRGLARTTALSYMEPSLTHCFVHADERLRAWGEPVLTQSFIMQVIPE